MHPVSRTAEKLDLPPLFEDLRQVWTERTTDILSFEKSLRDLAVTAASTAATESQHELSASSHKLQRRVGRFTAVLVVLAVIQTLILADLSWVEILSRTAWFLFSLPW